MARSTGLVRLLIVAYLRVVEPVPSSSPAVREKSRYAQGASIACVRSDLLEVPTGLLPVIRAFQTDKPQMRKLRCVSFHGRLLPVCASAFCSSTVRNRREVPKESPKSEPDFRRTLNQSQADHLSFRVFSLTFWNKLLRRVDLEPYQSAEAKHEGR